MGAFEPCACWTNLIIWASIVSRPTLVARKRNEPVRLMVAPMPATKRAGDNVIGATINRTGSFRFRATRVGRDTMLAQIIKLVQQAQGSKAPIQRLADAVSSY